MKIYISADIEGITGVTHWDETDKEKADYANFREQMTSEVSAACNAAFEAGAKEVWVRDAHDSARNLIGARLPKAAFLVRGWGSNPLMMMENINDSFDAVMFIGYHSRAGANTNPLSHTMSGAYTRIIINGIYASEFLINTYTASMFKVPVIFVSGDKGLCTEVAEVNSNIGTVAVKQGIGNSTINMHPDLALDFIRDGVIKALKSDISRCRVALPEHFSVDVTFKDHTKAQGCSFFPGAVLKEPTTVHFEHKDYFEVLRFLFFIL